MTNSQQYVHNNTSYQAYQKQTNNQDQVSLEQSSSQASSFSGQFTSNNLGSVKNYTSHTQNLSENYELNISQIFKFLRNNGYVATADSLLFEINSQKKKLKKNAYDDQSNNIDLEQLDKISDRISNVEEYNLFINYTKFRNWVFNSLSSVREELLSICFFVFIQTYFILLKVKSDNLREKFFIKFYDDFLMSRYREIINLLKISNKLEHSKNINLLKPYFDSKFHIVLKPISFSLLNHYLFTLNDTFIIGIIQEKLVMHLYDVNLYEGLSLNKLSGEEINYSQEISRFQIGELYSEDSLLIEINSLIDQKSENLQETSVKDKMNEVSISGKCTGFNNSCIRWGIFPENYSGIISKDTEIKRSRFDRFDREITEELKDHTEIDFLPINDPNNPFTIEYKKQQYEEVLNRQYIDSTQLPSIISNCLTCTNPAEIIDMNVSHSHELGAFSTNDGCIQVYDIKNPENKIMPSWIHRNRTQCIKFHPWNQEFLLSGGIDSTIKLSLITKHSTETTLNQIITFNGHSSNSCIWDLDWDNYGISFVSGSSDQTARLWCTSRTYPIRIFNGHLGDVRSVTTHPNSSIVATGGSDNQIFIWDIRTGKREGSIYNEKIMSGIVNQVKFAHNGYLLASSSIYDPLSQLYSQNHLSLPIWDIRKLKNSIVSPTECYQLCKLPNEILSFNQQMFIKSIDFSFGSRILACVTNNAVVSLWDTNLTTCFDQIDHSNKEFNSIQIYKLKNFSTKNLRFLSRNLLSVSSVKIKDLIK